MAVRLISYSKASEFAVWGDNIPLNCQDLIAFCARVSNPDNQNNNKTAPGLLKYLIKHGHWSPFEMVSVTLEIQTTRDISHQIVRHRSFSFQEFSQRYADVNEQGMQFKIRETRLQDLKNRQNSIEIENDPTIQLNVKQQELVTEWQRRQHGVINNCREVYEWAIKNGIAKEQARAVLPEGLTSSRLYANGTLRSWVHYIELRGANGTQKEHMEIAHACADVIAEIFPMIRELK